MLFLADAETRTVHLLKWEQGAVYTSLSWKQDGSEISYSFFNGNVGKYCISSFNLSSGKDTVLYEDNNIHQNHPAWSPDNHLAFWVNGKYENQIIAYVFFLDGKPFYFGHYCEMSQSGWSPDGKYLSAASKNAICRINRDDSTGELVYIADNDSAYIVALYTPDYSPDGTKMAFIKSSTYTNDTINFTSTSELWIINADGSEPVKITENMYDWRPHWSPDGKYIAFIRSFEGKPNQLMLVDVITGTEYILNQKGAFSFDWLQDIEI